MHVIDPGSDAPWARLVEEDDDFDEDAFDEELDEDDDDDELDPADEVPESPADDPALAGYGEDDDDLDDLDDDLEEIDEDGPLLN